MDTCDCVQQVWSGVALQAQHLVPRKHVVAGAILREVCIAHSADAHDAGDFPSFFFAEVGILFRDQRKRTFFRLVQQSFEANGLSTLGLYGLTILTEDRPPPYVVHLGKFASTALKPLGRR